MVICITYKYVGVEREIERVKCGMPEHGINVFDIFDVAYDVIELFELFNRSHLFNCVIYIIPYESLQIICRGY